VLLIIWCFVWLLISKNGGNFLHGGATATLVDLVGSAAIFTVGAPATGVSVEINVSYLDAAFADVGISPPLSYILFLACVFLNALIEWFLTCLSQGWNCLEYTIEWKRKYFTNILLCVFFFMV